MTIIWDRQAPHTVPIQVQSEDIDELGHVNNAAYVRWMESCAWQHSQSLGLGLTQYRALDRAMVVHRHEIDYLAAAYLGDELTMATWIMASDSRLRLTREFQLCRLADGLTLLRARSRFICIELSTGKARRMPPAFIGNYGVAMTTE